MTNDPMVNDAVAPEAASNKFERKAERVSSQPARPAAQTATGEIRAERPRNSSGEPELVLDVPGYVARLRSESLRLARVFAATGNLRTQGRSAGVIEALELLGCDEPQPAMLSEEATARLRDRVRAHALPLESLRASSEAELHQDGRYSGLILATSYLTESMIATPQQPVGATQV